MKDNLKIAFWYCLMICFWGIILYFGIRSCVSCDKEDKQIKTENLRDQFIKDSLAHVADSLANDSCYQDSIRRVRENIYREWKERDLKKREHTLVLICDSPKIYHTNTKCSRIYRHKQGTENMNAYKLTSEQKAIDANYKFCSFCNEIEEVYWKYEDGVLVEYNEDYNDKDDDEDGY